MKKTYKIEVDCPNCANKMEMAVSKVQGVKGVSVNFMAQKITIEFEEGAIEREVLINAKKASKRVEEDIEIYF